MTARLLPGHARARPWYFCLLLSLDPACAPPAVPPWVHPTEAQWRAASGRLDRLRTELPDRPYTAVVTTALREPLGDRTIDGRGAIAVSPGLGLRMILVGVAGATLLDAWITPTRWRVAVPVLAMVRRGATEAPPELPVTFLRWWFFRRFQGNLLAARTMPWEWLWLLRDGDAVVDLRLTSCAHGSHIAAARRELGHTQRVDECRCGGLPRAGDTVHYTDDASGFEMDLVVEEVSTEAPDPEAFRDPDLDSEGAAGSAGGTR